MKQKYIDAYMDVAHRFAQLSSAKRLQVGAIIVKDDRIISIGYNGMPVKKVYFRKHYRDSHGIEFLKQCNIEIEISPGEIS